MKWSTYRLELLTPTFISGADQSRAEIRVPSIRGQLRWWFRVLGGTKAEEWEIFGGLDPATPRAGKVRLRLKEPVESSNAVNLRDLRLDGTDEAYLLWPLRPTRAGDQRRGVLEPGTTFEIQAAGISALAREASVRFEGALAAWALLGSLGTRSRRGYGSVWPAGESSSNGAPSSLDELVEAIRKAFQPFRGFRGRVRTLAEGYPEVSEALGAAARWLRDFRVGSTRYGMRPRRWARNDHDAALGPGKTLYRPVLGLPLTQRYSDGRRIETEYHGGDRWASPVHLKIVRCGGLHYPLAVFFPQMAMREGTELRLIEGRRPVAEKVASRDLFNEMMKTTSESVLLWDSI